MADIKNARTFANANGIQRISVEYNTVDSQQLKSWANAIEQALGVSVRFLSDSSPISITEVRSSFAR